MTIGDIAKAVDSEAKQKIIGIRPGEKIHEQMIGIEDAHYTYEYPEHYKILPAIHEWDRDAHRIKNGTRVADDFSYTSDNNSQWLSAGALQKWLDENHEIIGKI